MQIPFEKLDYTFTHKPILVGGMAMEYYGLRKSGNDIDLIATKEDVANLIKLYSDRVKNLGGDLGVCPFEFEIWKTIRYFDYDFYIENAIEEENYFVISLEKLLLMKALAMDSEKYLNDTKLIVAEINKRQGTRFDDIKASNEAILSGIENITYIEQK